MKYWIFIVFVLLIVVIASFWFYARTNITNNIVIINIGEQAIDGSTNYAIENVAGNGCAVGTNTCLTNQIAHV